MLLPNLKKNFPDDFQNLNVYNIKTKEQTQKIYQRLLIKQQTAIKNAEKLLTNYGDNHKPESDNPSTTIHKLVLELNSI